ncbi:hypothetical protein D915_004958 [Fasciola hepatica]|uniref:Uncharacterized protein n=1 Tax=Fasciola hepatica TaxID=6192 RepID=A0A4E0RYX9_FASHE|nr:hypothetical protein D915_004958 [Fasciola hepatica]
MNLYRTDLRNFVTCIILQCILDLFKCSLKADASPLTQPPANDEMTTFGDSVDLGITNILSIVESISSATNNQLVNQVMDDPAAYHITSAAQLRQLNDPEYSRFNCEIQCGVRQVDSVLELKRVQTLLPHVLVHQSVVIDCARTGDSSTGMLNTDLINVDCVAHYTGRLIHVVVSFDESALLNKSVPTPVILGDRFSENIQHVFDQHASKDQKSATSLYVTLDLPIRTLDAADLVPISSNLKYLAISSSLLQTLDTLLLQDLHLDYFLLDGCHRIQERISRPTETKISPLPARAHQWNCVVIWSFICQTAGEFELLADAKTQERLCQRRQPQSDWRPVEQAPDRATRPPKVRPRTRRSPTRLSTSGTVPPSINLGDPWPFFAEKLIHRFEEEIKNFGNDVRRDISWYQTMMNLFVAVLAFALLILGATLVAFWIFLRQVLRGKVKPARATL